jgi:hypothetical protein
MSDEQTKDEIMSDFIKKIKQHKKNDKIEIKNQLFA